MTGAAPDVDRFVAALTRFIETELLERRHALGTDTYLFDTGLIDSLKILPLIAFVEHWTGRPVAEHDIVMKNFRSVRAIATRFVAPMAELSR